MQQAQKTSTPRNLRQGSQRLLQVSDVEREVHLDKESLEGTQRRGGAVGNAIFGDQTCNVHAQVAKGREAYQTVDGLMERLQKEEGGQDEQDAEDGQDGDDTFGDGEGINLCLSERHAFRV